MLTIHGEITAEDRVEHYATFLLVGLVVSAAVLGSVVPTFTAEDSDEDTGPLGSWSYAWVWCEYDYYMGNPQWYEVLSSDHDWDWGPSAFGGTPEKTSGSGGVNTPAWTRTKVLVYSGGQWYTDSHAYCQVPY